MQAVFKIALRGDKLSERNKDSLEELVDSFTVLISATDFLEVSTFLLGGPS